MDAGLKNRSLDIPSNIPEAVSKGKQIYDIGKQVYDEGLEQFENPMTVINRGYNLLDLVSKTNNERYKHPGDPVAMFDWGAKIEPT